MVWEYQGEKFLSTSKENAKVESISDFGIVREESACSRVCLTLFAVKRC